MFVKVEIKTGKIGYFCELNFGILESVMEDTACCCSIWRRGGLLRERQQPQVHWVENLSTGRDIKARQQF